MRRHNGTPTLDEALQVVLGRSRPASAAVATSVSAAPQSTLGHAIPKQFTWSPMFMSPGSSQNPLHLSSQATRPSAGPVARAHWQQRLPNQETPLQDSTVNSFVNSRGLFQQTLTSHQHAMASRHQMALHELSTAINHAVGDTPNNATVPRDIAGKVPLSAVDRNTSGSESTLLGNYKAPTMLDKRVASSSSAGNCAGNMVCDDSESSAAVVDAPSQQSTVGVLQHAASQESNLSCDSLTTAEPRQSHFISTASQKSQASDEVHGNLVISDSSISESSVLENSEHSQVRKDVNENVAAPAVGAACLDSHLWEGLRPTCDCEVTSHYDTQDHSQADHIKTNLSSVEAGIGKKDQNGSIGNGTNVSTAAENTIEHMQCDRSVVTGNGSAVERAGTLSTGGGSSSSFFLHRNAPSPNIAIVQPNIHPAIPQPSSTDQCSTTHCVQPLSAVSSCLQEQNVPSCPQNANKIDQYSDKDSTDPLSNVSSGLQERIVPSGATNTAHIDRQPIVGFVSIHAQSPPNTMTVLPPEIDHVLPLSQPPETYKKQSSDPVSTDPGTIFAIPPSYMSRTNYQMTEFSNGKLTVLGFSNDKSRTLDFPSAMCIKDNIAYEDIPVDDTSSVSSVMSDVIAASASGPG